MAKDPAFLFYPNDYLGGTMGMSFDLKGAYVELLLLQFNKPAGVFREKDAINLIGQERWTELKAAEKFKTEGETFFNERLRKEMEKRSNFTTSRRNNRKGKDISSTHDSTHDTTHVEDMENENENINKDKFINNVEALSLFDKFRTQYPGKKRGNETEFENFKKKHADWMQVLPSLHKKLLGQIVVRNHKKTSGKFVPEWKNLQTWINQRCWEETEGGETQQEKNYDLPN